MSAAQPPSVIPELQGLGSRLDARDFLPPHIAPWAEGDTPHGETVDLDEYSVALLKMKKCRSFRADLRHKLIIIVRAHGGNGRRGVWRAAKSLRVTRQSLWKWLRWDTSPRTRLLFERIDNQYSDALEKLVADKIKRRRKYVKKLRS